MPHLQCGAVRVHYSDSGAGPAVVLLHGVGSSGSFWTRPARLFGTSYRLVAVDHYGHGGTDVWPGVPAALTHDDEAALVEGVIDALGAPVHLVGHSYGGGVALRLALRDARRLRSLALIEPTAMSILRHAGETGHFDFIHRLATGFLERAGSGLAAEAWGHLVDGNSVPGAWDSLPEDAKASLVAMTGTGIGAIHGNLNHHTTLDELAAIDLPALVVCGERTPPVHRRMAELVAEHLPRGRLETIAGAGHLSPITHSAPVATVIAAHLADH